MIDLDGLPLGFEQVNVRMQVVLDALADCTLLARIAALGWTIQYFGEGQSGSPFAHPSRPEEQIRWRQTLVLDSP
jgi:hypothetical protein